MESGTQMTFEEYMPEIFPSQTAGASGSLVRTSPSQESSSDLLGIAQASFLELCTFLDSSQKKKNPLTYSLRMLKICLVLMEGGILPDFSLKWTVAGTMRNGKFSIPKILEFRKTESECSLSDILEDEVEEKYFLSDMTVRRLLSYKDAKVVEE